jgi:hypothetical protein
MLIGVYLFIGVVICAGVSIGVLLQIKLDATNQDIKLPSLFQKAA